MSAHHHIRVTTVRQTPARHSVTIPIRLPTISSSFLFPQKNRNSPSKTAPVTVVLYVHGEVEIPTLHSNVELSDQPAALVPTGLLPTLERRQPLVAPLVVVSASCILERHI